MADRSDPTVNLSRLLPGRVRVAMQIYHPNLTTYSQLPGVAQPGIRVRNRREADRLWAQIQEVIDAAKWRDVAATQKELVRADGT